MSLVHIGWMLIVGLGKGYTVGRSVGRSGDSGPKLLIPFSTSTSSTSYTLIWSRVRIGWMLIVGRQGLFSGSGQLTLDRKFSCLYTFYTDTEDLFSTHLQMY